MCEFVSHTGFAVCICGFILSIPSVACVWFVFIQPVEEPVAVVVKGGALVYPHCLRCLVTLQLAVVLCLSQGHSHKHTL